VIALETLNNLHLLTRLYKATTQKFMKKIVSSVFLVALTVIAASAFINKKSSTGYAGYTGSPGESTCTGNGSCHGGGSASASGITVTSHPAFSVNANSDSEYLPDTTYQITITASATGFTRYGFGCEILNNTFTNTGNLQNPGSGVKFLTSIGRKNAVHSTTKLASSGTATFTFKWVAPASGSGDATIYTVANAVNGNANTTGDFVIDPISTILVEGTPPLPPPDTTGIKENTNFISQLNVFPNPASDITNISYSLSQAKTISIELVDIRGAVIKQLYEQNDAPGFHSQILNLQGVASGVYFIKTSANQQKISQKLITVQ